MTIASIPAGSFDTYRQPYPYRVIRPARPTRSNADVSFETLLASEFDAGVSVTPAEQTATAGLLDLWA